MSNLVGTKGQIVIEKSIRDRLGVKPGWKAIQTLNDDHVEIYLVPPEHDRSLAGCLAGYTEVRAPTSESLNEARAAVREEQASESQEAQSPRSKKSGRRS